MGEVRQRKKKAEKEPAKVSAFVQTFVQKFDPLNDFFKLRASYDFNLKCY